MVDEETVRLMIGLAVLTQALTERFTFFTEIGKDQAFPAAGMFEDIADAWISGLGRRIARFLQYRRCIDELPAFISLRATVEEMFHG